MTRVGVRLCWELDQEIDGHQFRINVEESSGSSCIFDGMEFDQPWLRANCSCGWSAGDYERFTLEENASWLWRKHVTEANS